MTSGRAALNDIEGALADLRREESQATARLTEVTDRIGKRQADEAEALRDLARFKIAAGDDALANRLDRASRDAREALAAREAMLAGLRSDREARETALAAADAKLAGDRKELDAIEERIEALAEELKQRLAADPEHQKLVAAAEEAAKVEEAAVSKAKQAEEDRASKSAAYEADALFMYLWRRKFGTAEYPYRGLTRFLDRWVARLIGYAEARPSYALLNEIPVRLAAHAERITAEAEAADAAVDASADKALAALAGSDLAGRGDVLTASIAEQEAAIGPLRAELQALEEKLAGFADGNDEAFRRAIDALSRSIAGDDINALKAEARRTPSPDDERLVMAIEQARGDIAALESEAGKLRADLQSVSKRRQELNSITNDFRRRGWDESGNTFDGGKFLGDILTGFILGRIGRDDFWGRIESSHRGGGSIWGRGSSSGGWGRSSSGSVWGRSSRGGGGFRTGRTFGGGRTGFRTGRSF